MNPSGKPVHHTKESLIASAVPQANGCLFLGACATDEYPTIRLSGRKMRANRAIWLLAFGPIPDGLMVCHKCDQPKCINPEHLFLGTAGDNIRDASAKGRMPGPFGAKCHRAKLTDETVLQIRKLHANGLDKFEIANRFGMSPSGIYKILCGDRWKHLFTATAA